MPSLLRRKGAAAQFHVGENARAHGQADGMGAPAPVGGDIGVDALAHAVWGHSLTGGNECR